MQSLDFKRATANDLAMHLAVHQEEGNASDQSRFNAIKHSGDPVHQCLATESRSPASRQTWPENLASILGFLRAIRRLRSTFPQRVPDSPPGSLRRARFGDEEIGAFPKSHSGERPGPGSELQLQPKDMWPWSVGETAKMGQMAAAIQRSCCTRMAKSGGPFGSPKNRHTLVDDRRVSHPPITRSTTSSRGVSPLHILAIRDTARIMSTPHHLVRSTCKRHHHGKQQQQQRI